MKKNITQKDAAIIGLTEREAKIRLKKFGENTVYKKRKIRPVALFIKKFNSPLLIILLAASIISFFAGEKTNAIILLLMVSVSAILDFTNSYKSERALDKLILRVVTTATVLREGQKKEIELKSIVPGDIILLSAGDVVPADSRVLESKDFFVNQSTLTGESMPVERIPGKTKKNTALSPQDDDAVFMGTSVVTGYATIRAVATGTETEFGKIAERLSRAEPETNFEKNIKKFSFFIMQITIVLVCFVFLINAFMGRGWLNSFIFALAIAIGLTPELLPVIISVSLSHGSILMAKKDVIVKNLSSIQNFGSMNVLCTDKTGTITEDLIVLIKNVDGFGNTSESVLFNAYLNSFFHTGINNPLDSAIKNYKKLDISHCKKIDEIPFDFKRKRQSIIVQTEASRIMVTKGAPEEVMKICTMYDSGEERHELRKDIKNKIENQFKKLSMEGFRVLAIATKKIDSPSKTFTSKEETDMVFSGFVAFLDPAKKTSAKAIIDLENLGIEIKIITGDNELLTQKICNDIKLAIKGVMTGEELGNYTDEELQRKIAKTTVFARINPEQKERIILNIKKTGQTVGYLGDGINDAPALKAADVGISVNNAVDVAKETADIILLQKSLRVLKDGVIEGRKTFHNSMKYIMMGLSSNFGNMFSMMGASIFLPFLPMLPTQILLNNFLYDSSQLSITTDTVDEEDIKKPASWNFKFIKKYMFTIGPISSIFDFLTFFLLYWGFHLGEKQFQAGWFMESIATQVFVIYIIRTKKIPFLQSRPSKLLFYNVILAVVIAWLIPTISLGKIFGFEALHPMVILAILGIVFVYLILVEVVKRIFYKYNSLSS